MPTRIALTKMSFLATVPLWVAVAGCPMVDPGDATSTAVGGTGDGTGAATRITYVSVAGDDEAGGLSPESALRSLAQALKTVRPGDTVVLLPGVYNESVVMEGVGDASAVTTVRGEGDGVILDGRRTMKFAMSCNRCRGFVFENLEIRNYTDMGLLVMASEAVTVRDLIVHDNGFAATFDWAEGYGMHVEESKVVTIENNEVFANGPAPQIPDRWLGTGIDTFALSDSVIRNNDSHDNIGGGLLVEDSVNVLVEGNRIANNELDATVEQWWDGGIWVDGGHDIVLRANIIENNNGPGIEISDEDRQSPFGYVLEGNTIRDNRWGLYIWNFDTADLPPTQILDVRSDNAISNNAVLDIWVLPQG